MNLALLRLLRPRRRISLWRVVGPGAWVSVAVWSALVLVVLGAYRDPQFFTRLGDVGGVGDAVGLLSGVVPPTVLPLVVAGVALVVVPLRLLREFRRAFRRRRRGYSDYGPVADGPDHLSGGVLGGGLLGGLADAFGGDDGDGGGGSGGGGGDG